MVNKLSDLAQFLESDSIPLWLKQELEEKQQEISFALEHGESITLEGPNGQSVKLTPGLPQ